jgi:hypothetical protein
MEKYFAVTAFGFILLSLGCLFLIYKGLNQALLNTPLSNVQKQSFKNRFLIGSGVWIALLAALSLTGVLSDFSSFPPKIMIVFIIPLIICVLLLFAKSFATILESIPFQWLIYIQSFRFFVEILIWMLFIDHLAPIQMTFEGRNIDILAGILAPIVGYLSFYGAQKRKWLIWAWNIFGLITLINILTVAVLSFPSPFRYFMNEPANTIVARFPIVFLPGILVPMAYYMHAFSIKQLLIKKGE